MLVSLRASTREMSHEAIPSKACNKQAGGSQIRRTPSFRTILVTRPNALVTSVRCCSMASSHRHCEACKEGHSACACNILFLKSVPSLPRDKTACL